MRQSARVLGNKTALLKLNNIIIMTINLPSSHDAKKSDPGQTPKVIHVLLYRGDVIEVDPPNHISN
jgi:hypothetical protein